MSFQNNLNMKPITLYGSVALQSSFSLEETGKTLSAVLFGDIQFKSRQECICDEVPAICLEHELLGLRVILSGYESDRIYTLELSRQVTSDFRLPPAQQQLACADISFYIGRLLEKIEGISIINVT